MSQSVRVVVLLGRNDEGDVTMFQQLTRLSVY